MAHKLVTFMFMMLLFLGSSVISGRSAFDYYTEKTKGTGMERTVGTNFAIESLLIILVAIAADMSKLVTVLMACITVTAVAWIFAAVSTAVEPLSTGMFDLQAMLIATTGQAASRLLAIPLLLKQCNYRSDREKMAAVLVLLHVLSEVIAQGVASHIVHFNFAMTPVFLTAAVFEIATLLFVVVAKEYMVTYYEGGKVFIFNCTQDCLAWMNGIGDVVPKRITGTAERLRKLVLFGIPLIFVNLYSVLFFIEEGFQRDHSTPVMPTFLTYDPEPFARIAAGCASFVALLFLSRHLRGSKVFVFGLLTLQPALLLAASLRLYQHTVKWNNHCGSTLFDVTAINPGKTSYKFGNGWEVPGGNHSEVCMSLDEIKNDFNTTPECERCGIIVVPIEGDLVFEEYQTRQIEAGIKVFLFGGNPKKSQEIIIDSDALRPRIERTRLEAKLGTFVAEHNFGGVYAVASSPSEVKDLEVEIIPPFKASQMVVEPGSFLRLTVIYVTTMMTLVAAYDISPPLARITVTSLLLVFLIAGYILTGAMEGIVDALERTGMGAIWPLVICMVVGDFMVMSVVMVTWNEEDDDSDEEEEKEETEESSED